MKNKCKKCNGAGYYMYDENHIKPCEVCCSHPDGWWKLEKHYGEDNGKYACKRGCGTLVDKLAGEEHLMQLTRDALADVLDRIPTELETLRTHAGFKRMASTIYERIEFEEKERKSVANNRS